MQRYYKPRPAAPAQPMPVVRRSFIDTIRACRSTDDLRSCEAALRRGASGGLMNSRTKRKAERALADAWERFQEQKGQP